MSSTKSESARLREQGNADYGKVTDGLAPTLQLRRLQQALISYDKALTAATDNIDRSSACKNMAMTNWKMAKASMVIGSNDKVISKYFKDALRHFQAAKEYGKGRDSQWINILVATGVNCWGDVLERVQEWQYEQRIEELQKLVGYIIDDVTMAGVYLDIAKYYFKWSVTSLAERKYKQSLQLLAECRFPLNEARRVVSDDPNTLEECQALEDDVFIQTCVAESIQARMNGEERLLLAMQNEEDLDVGKVWDVVDLFRTAAMLTREHDLELEAMALSALGRLYDKVLKMKDRARTCLRRVLELADAMVPRAVWTCEWYEYARLTLERYQREGLQAEQEEKQKEREATMKLIKDDLHVLQKKFTDGTKLQFLKFVYEKYPPKNPNHKLGKVPDKPEPDDLKKLYRAAAIHYHPDKVKEDEHGMKWKVLTEEITKLITKHYEYFKDLA